MPEPDRTMDELDPYTPPTGRLRRDRVVAPGPSAPSPGTILWVDHDLDDRDLRRMPECDLFYDPVPLLGFIPQWIVVGGILNAVGLIAMLSWLPRDTPIHMVSKAGLVGMLGAISILYGIHSKMTVNRKAVRAAGLCEGRRMTITADGLRVRITGRPEALLFGLGEGTAPWSEFRRVQFLGGYLIFWMAGRRRLVVPERAFPSARDADAFALAAASWIVAAR